MRDEELAHLYDEVAERVAEADGRKGAAHEEKARARKQKENNGEMWANTQVQTKGKGARPPPRPKSSREECARRTSSRARLTSSEEGLAVIIPKSQKRQVGVLRSHERLDALDDSRNVTRRIAMIHSATPIEVPWTIGPASTPFLMGKAPT
eukprot:scaffold420_cov342-Pavlova_lutheri.AAC.7